MSCSPRFKVTLKTGFWWIKRKVLVYTLNDRLFTPPPRPPSGFNERDFLEGLSESFGRGGSDGGLSRGALMSESEGRGLTKSHII